MTRYDYDGQNRLVKVTDARGVVIAQNSYSLDNRVVQQIHADGGKTKIAFIPGTGVRTAAAQELDSAQDHLPGGGGAPIGPPPREPVWVVVDPLGRISNYRFDPAGYLLSAIDPLAQITRFNRAPGTNLLQASRGNATCGVCGDPATGDISYTHDTSGNVVTQTDALGNTTNFTYEPVFNNVATITDPLGSVRRFSYDERGNLKALSDENGQTIHIVYDEYGQPTVVTDPMGRKTEFNHDSFGHLVEATDPLGNSVRFRYDVVSRLIEVTDASGSKTRYVYDRSDRLVEQIDSQGNSSHATYDSTGNLLSFTDARGKTRFFTYDEMNRMSSRTDPAGATETFTYDLAGNLIEHVDRRGLATAFEYDALDRLVLKKYADGGTIRRSYDARGRLARVEDSVSGLYLFTYDALGQVTSESGPFGTVRYSYDALGQVTSREVVGHDPVNYAYDPVGNLLEAAMGGTAVSFAYDARDLLDRMVRSNGVTTDFAYDDVGQLTSLTHAAAGSVIDVQSYTYEAAGNRRGRNSQIAALLATEPSLRSYDDANRLLTDGTSTYTYDANGNLASKTGPEDTTTYTWDAQNQLQTIASPDGATVEFLYDFAGNLIQKRVTGSDSDLTERYILDDLTNIAQIQRSSGGNLTVLSGRTIDEHLAVLGEDGAEFVLTDAINSTVATVDETGVVSSRFTYEPYGETTIVGDAVFPFQFTGRLPVDGEIYYYRARYYDSVLGRFVSEDPIGLEDADTNLYRYVSGNPINRVDPLGLFIIPRVAVCWFKMNKCGAKCLTSKCGSPGDIAVCAAWCSDWGRHVCMATGVFPRNPHQP